MTQEIPIYIENEVIREIPVYIEYEIVREKEVIKEVPVPIFYDKNGSQTKKSFILGSQELEN